jgi:hypothetical protein
MTKNIKKWARKTSKNAGTCTFEITTNDPPISVFMLMPPKEPFYLAGDLNPSRNFMELGSKNPWNFFRDFCGP